jgi:Antimicrobial peptide resistance and lipid A acylation protein PagP
MRAWTWTAIVATSLGAGNAALAQDTGSRWDVVLNGHAVHVNAARRWNEDNWGLGFEREFGDGSARWVKVALGNGFKDSMGNPSYMAGAGLKRRFTFGSRREAYADLGVVGFMMTREDVNDNRPFPGALPAATFGWKRVALNVTYMPRSIVDRVTHADRYDPSMDGVVFLQIKLDASLFGFSRQRGLLASEN